MAIGYLTLPVSMGTAMTSASTAPAELLWLAPAVVSPNPWNPNQMDPDMLEHARASIREFGFVDPVTCRHLGEDLYQIIDGEHRWRIAIELGMESIPVINLGPITDAVAQQLTIVLNETRGQADPERLGRLLKELMATETKEHLLSTLPYTREALDRLTGLPSLTWEALDRPARPLLPVERPSAWIERTFRMPRDASEVLDQALAKVREREDPDAPEWQALEFLAADFLAS